MARKFLRVYGRKILKEAITSGVKIKKVYFAEYENPSKEFLNLIELVKSKGIPFKIVSKKKLENLIPREKTQGVVFDIEEIKYYTLEEILQEKKNSSLVVILDQIQDPHNFGAIIRTSVAAGVDFIVIPKNNSVKITPAVIKVSAGLAFKIPIVVETNLSRSIEILKENGFWIYAADRDGNDYYQLDLTGKAGFVFGNEGKGIRKLVKSHCDSVISIPMTKNVDSLNVSVSAGIIIYEAVRQRLTQ